jgi:hypothetical protein
MNIDYDIIFPFYKDYEFLNNQLEQINNQTLIPKNLIFIDDGNKDKNLQKIIRKNIKKEIELIFISFSKNNGVYFGINEGVKNLKSQYFRINSADDIIYPQLAEKSLTLINNYPERNFVFSNNISNFIEKNKKIKIKLSFLKKKDYSKHECDLIFKKYQFKIYHNTIFYRTSYFLENNLFKEEIGPRRDFFNIIFFSLNTGFCYLDDFLSEFTIRSGQLNKLYDTEFLYNELINIEKNFPKLYSYYINSNMHFDFNPLASFKFMRNKKYDLITTKWMLRSIKFHLWKSFREFMPNKLTQKIFELIN